MLIADDLSSFTKVIMDLKNLSKNFDYNDHALYRLFSRSFV